MTFGGSGLIVSAFGTTNKGPIRNNLTDESHKVKSVRESNLGETRSLEKRPDTAQYI